MIYPKVNIISENKPYYKALYLCFLAKSIASGYFQRGNFYVVPHSVKRNPNAVYFPDLKYSKSFWRAISNNPNDNLNDLYPKGCIEEIEEKLLRKNQNIEGLESKLKNDWNKMERSFFANLDKILNFQKEISKISEIKILLTPFGTRSSFYVSKKANKNTALITCRTDFPAGNIAKSIIHCLYILKNKKGGKIGENKFIERMAIVDFIFKNTLFQKYLNPYYPTQKTEVPGIRKLIKESNKYLKKLGFPAKEILTLQNGYMFMDQTQINKYFSKQEEAVLHELIKLKGRILYNDDMADILWGENTDEKFSLEAIAKVIQNTRDKLRKFGINKNLIHTVRGKGYFLS